MTQAATTYIGTKVIKATPMTRLEYNNLRGWDLPADERGDDTGYLVEYMDGGQANHPDYAGYISWSPSAVFTAAYTPTQGEYPTDAPEFLQRLWIELQQLNHRIRQLDGFINKSPIFSALTDLQQSLLTLQFNTMIQYEQIILMRVNDMAP